MRSSPGDTLARLCVRRVRGWLVFPLVPSLGSARSAPGCPALFAGFTATMDESDFSASVHHRLRLLAFPMRAVGPYWHRWSDWRSPGSRARSVRTCQVSSTTPGRPSACAGALVVLPSATRDSVGTRDQFSIAAQWLACTFPYRRFADTLADACARLGADVVRYSFIAVDLHHLLLAGLPAHLCENSKNRKTTRIIFRKNLRPDKPAKFRRPEMTFGGMPILRRCSAAAFQQPRPRTDIGPLGP